MNIEVIDIDGSSGTEEEGEYSNISNIGALTNQVDEKKPDVTLNTVTIPSPTQILEARRRKIDELLECYGDTHNRLLSLLPFMNPNQKTQWHKLLNTKQKQVLPELAEALQPESQSQPSHPSLNRLRNELNMERNQVAARIKREAKVRRYKRKKSVRKRGSPKKTYTARKTPTTSKPTTSKPTTSKPTTSKPSTYTPRVNIKTEYRPARSALFAHVKKEK